MPSLRLRNDNILVRMHSDEQESKGGIILPATRSKHPNQAVLATVLAIGPGTYPEVKSVPGRREPRDVPRCHRIGGSKLIPTEVCPNDVVIVDSPHCGDHYGDADDDLRIVREAEILAVVEGAEPGKGEVV